jgi:pyruvate dehydrogenase E1 component alpha subunit
LELDREKLLEMYRKMVTIRRFEEKVAELNARGVFPGLAHLYIGEEAVAVGACSALRADDLITSTHRGHGHCIAKGCDLKPMMAELLGRYTGYCKGKGGSMHICDFDRGILGANGIVGSNIPIAAGAALGIKMMRQDRVVLCFFGDGASNGGSFHEGLNFASIWKLPVVFVCEHNMYAISMPTKKSTSVANIADRASAYGMPGEVVDGQDVLAVYEAARRAVARARRGDGPSLLECKTYRWYGHFAGDEHHYGGYRSVEEVEAWRARCPIRGLREYAISKGIPAEELDLIEERVRAKVEEAERFALGSPEPGPRVALEDVYA